MKTINLDNIFSTEPRYKRLSKKNSQNKTVYNDRYTKKFGFMDKIIVSAQIITEPRYKRLETRKVDTSPFRILDAPGVYDDYYLNILDWSSNNYISICLAEEIYLYDVANKDVINLATFKSGVYASSLRSNGNVLAAGISNGDIIFYDVEKCKLMGKCSFHQTRVTSLDWNGNVLSSGSRTGLISNIDLRDNKEISKFKFHTQEVCGLKWSNSKRYLASGANDNCINIWQLGSNSPRYTLNGHSSAVKALDWCPWRVSILASGGGSKDKTVRFWDIETGTCESSVEMSSQVCGIHFLARYKEMVTAHGYSENDICLWKVSNFKKICSFGKHDNRVLYTVLSPDQTIVASLAADENLKFWRILDRTDVSTPIVESVSIR